MANTKNRIDKLGVAIAPKTGPTSWRDLITGKPLSKELQDAWRRFLASAERGKDEHK